MRSALPAFPSVPAPDYLRIPLIDRGTHCEIEATFAGAARPYRLLVCTNSLESWIGFKDHPYDSEKNVVVTEPGELCKFMFYGRTFVGAGYYEIMILERATFLQSFAIPDGFGQGVVVPGGPIADFQVDGVLSLAAPDLSQPIWRSNLSKDNILDSLLYCEAIEKLQVTILKGKFLIFGRHPVPPKIFTVPVTKTLPYCDFWGFEASLEYDGHEIVSSTGIIDYTQPYLGLDAESFQNFLDATRAERDKSSSRNLAMLTKPPGRGGMGLLVVKIAGHEIRCLIPRFRSNKLGLGVFEMRDTHGYPEKRRTFVLGFTYLTKLEIVLDKAARTIGFSKTIGFTHRAAHSKKAVREGESGA